LRGSRYSCGSAHVLFSCTMISTTLLPEAVEGKDSAPSSPLSPAVPSLTYPTSAAPQTEAPFPPAASAAASQPSSCPANPSHTSSTPHSSSSSSAAAAAANARVGSLRRFGGHGVAPSVGSEEYRACCVHIQPWVLVYRQLALLARRVARDDALDVLEERGRRVGEEELEQPLELGHVFDELIRAGARGARRCPAACE